MRALDGVSIEVHAGELTALVGPDGAGKTTLIRLMAGLLTADGGTLRVLDIDPAVAPQHIQDRIGYMPQKFGLYEDLSVQENLDLYADLHGVSAEERTRRYPQLMQMTDLGRFTSRLAGRLSGGMKQKLGLACTLVRSPELLLLDEPTVGVDPLSRRELWAIVEQLVHEQGLTVLMSTSYLDEAERAARVLVLHEGKALAQSEPAAVTRVAARHSVVLDPGPGNSARSLQARLLDDPQVIDAVPDGGLVRLVCAPSLSPEKVVAGFEVTAVEPRFEDGFMMLLRGTASHEAGADIRLQRPLAATDEGAVVEVRDLLKRFGDFTAVDHVSFEVRRGEIFGLLGPNGAGKTTTFRMLCGLLPPSGGVLESRWCRCAQRPGPPRGHDSGMSRRSSPSTGRSPSGRTWSSLQAHTGCAARCAVSASTGPCGSSISSTTGTRRAVSCPAASSSASPWARRCCTSRTSSSSTSRPAAPIRWRVAPSGGASPPSPSRV